MPKEVFLEEVSTSRVITFPRVVIDEILIDAIFDARVVCNCTYNNVTSHTIMYPEPNPNQTNNPT